MCECKKMTNMRYGTTTKSFSVTSELNLGQFYKFNFSWVGWVIVSVCAHYWKLGMVIQSLLY